MTKPLPFANLIPNQGLRWLLLVALIALGLLGNYFKYPLFFEIDFLFGSIFSFLILQFFGRAYGIGSALFVSGVTYFIWGHPYALIIMTAELAFVAMLTGRYKTSLVFADAIYWVLLGMPMVYFFYHRVMGVPEAVTTITLTKQAVNGITNVLIARLIFTLIGFRVTAFSINLREILHTCMVLCVALPMLILIILDSRSDFEKGIAQTQVELKEESVKINKAVQLWIKNRDAGLNNIASVAQLGDSTRTQAALDQHRNSDLNLLRLGLLSPSFISTLYSPQANDQGKSNIGVDFSDRPFVPLLRAQAKPVLSDIMQPRLGSTAPIVAFLHPVLKDGQVKGYISGVMSLGQVTQLIADQVGTSALRFTLIDRSGNVIATNREDQKSMTPLALGEGNFKKIDDSTSQWFPKIRANAPFYERFRNSYYFRESTLGLNSDWRLLLEQPVGPMQKALSEIYTQRLTLLLIFLLLGTLTAELVGRQILKAFDTLSESTADLPAKLSSGHKVGWPNSQMVEIQNLIANFQSMATSLQIEFAATRDANALLEGRVASRTEALTASNAKLELLEVCVSRLNDIVLITEAEPFDQPGPSIVFVNDAFIRRTGYSREEVIGKTPRILQGPNTQRSELDRIGAAMRRREPVRAELINYTKAGLEYWIELDIVPIANDQGSYTHWVAVERDVTERKLADVVLRASEARRKVATDSGRIAIWEVDLKTNQLIWDENCFDLYQIREEDFKGTFEEWSRTIHPQDLDSVVQAFQAAVAGITEYDLAFRIIWPSGEVRHIEAHGKVSRNGDGVPERMIGTNWDITEQKLTEETLHSSVREKSALLKEVHHRVKNNMQVITSLLRMESRRSTVDDTKAVLGDMKARIRAMALLHESLYRSGTFASVDLGSYLRQLATQAFQTQLTSAGEVQLVLNLGSVQVGMDQAIPCGLLINELISNCLKHGFPTGVAGHVSIELEPIDKANQWRLCVRDSGVGLPDNFEDKRKNSLGLQLVGDLARQIGGELKITANEDKGVAFTVKFWAIEPAPLVMPA